MRAELRPSQVAPGAVLELEGEQRTGSSGPCASTSPAPAGASTASRPTPGPPEWLSIRAARRTVRHPLDPAQRPLRRPRPRRHEIDGRDWTLARGRVAHLHRRGRHGTGRPGTCDFVEFVATDYPTACSSSRASTAACGRSVSVDSSTRRACAATARSSATEAGSVVRGRDLVATTSPSTRSGDRGDAVAPVEVARGGRAPRPGGRRSPGLGTGAWPSALPDSPVSRWSASTVRAAVIRWTGAPRCSSMPRRRVVASSSSTSEGVCRPPAARPT